MNIAVIGNDLFSYVVAAVFASVGNNIDLLDNDQFISVANNEPDLPKLFNRQIESNRITFIDNTNNIDDTNNENIDYDFIILTEINLSKDSILLNEHLNHSLQNNTTVIILRPSEIGEAQAFLKLLQLKQFNASVCSLPLLIREGRAILDLSRPSSIIVGCDQTDDQNKIESLFYPFNRNKNVIKNVSTKEAEFSSFASLAMLATRLSFMNEMASLAERSQIDIEVVRKCLGSDPRIGQEYLYPGCGYGGKTLDDNVQKISSQLQLRSDDLGLLHVVSKINERQKDLLFRKIWSFFETNLKGKHIAIWGASFKPGSSSLNGAPAITLIDSLLAQSARVTVYDPLAKEALEKHYNAEPSSNLTITDSAIEAIEHADVLAICTEWKEFWSPNFSLLSKVLKRKAIFDGRNILDPKQVTANNLAYFGVGRGDPLLVF